MKQNLEVAVVQLCSSNNVSDNRNRIFNILSEIPQHINLVSLPENTFFMRLNEVEVVQYLDFEDSFWDDFKNLALKKDFYIHVGGTPLKKNNKKWNSTVLISPKGDIHAPYQKIHLFDIHLENKKPILESEIFDPGTQPSIIDIYGWKFGLSICYDLRFSELFSIYEKSNVDGLLIPAAFLNETGKMHWDILMRARAIESQCFVVAAAQGGAHSEYRNTFGHSLVVSPWGHKIIEILDKTKESFQTCTLIYQDLVNMRTQMPMKFHRKLK